MIVDLPKKLRCKRCPWKWIPRKKDVRICPHCKSPYWDTKKTKKAKKAKRAR